MWFILQCASVVALLLIVSVLIYLLTRHVKNRGQIEYYRAQGVHAPPGYIKPIVGHMLTLSAVRNLSESLVGTEKPSPKNLL